MSYLRHFPLIRIGVDTQPICHSVLKMTVTITPKFVWSDRWNKSAENYWIVVNCDDTIIYSQPFTILKKDYVKSRTKEFEANFYVPFPRMKDKPKEESSVYIVQVYYDNWIEARDSEIVK